MYNTALKQSKNAHHAHNGTKDVANANLAKTLAIVLLINSSTQLLASAIAFQPVANSQKDGTRILVLANAMACLLNALMV